jgi:predicted nucleic acid-binding protein
MSVFIDTNVLVRSIEPSSPMHEPAVRAIASVIESGEPVVLTPQIMAEFRNVVTRPLERNGLGLSPEEARDEIVRMEGFFSLLGETEEVYTEWKRLVMTYKVIGVQVHDARLVAAMKVNGIERLLTFDAQDFLRYKDIIQIVHPESVGAFRPGR